MGAYVLGWGVFWAVVALLFEVSVKSAAIGFVVGVGLYSLIAVAAIMAGYKFLGGNSRSSPRRPRKPGRKGKSRSPCPNPMTW